VSPVDVLAQARAAGVGLLVHDGKLASRGATTPDLRAAIRDNRAALLALLTGKPQRPPEPPPLPDDDEHARWLRGEISLATTDPIAWTGRRDVSLAVEDLADEGWRPRRISRTLGLAMREVVTILRRTGR
jgi:hypothetical protein